MAMFDRNRFWNVHKWKCSYWNIVIGLVVVIVLWNQYICYRWTRLFWPVLPENKDDVKIVFVADPQLQGYHDVYLPHYTLAQLAIWDADGYLAKGFYQAYHHVKPHVVVFLGDLLDEGSTSNANEFTTTVQRFNEIYHTDPSVKKVFVWGDNDVGGEGMDLKTPQKTKRFMEAFQPKDTNEESKNWALQTYRNIQFLKLDQDWGDKFTHGDQLKDILNKAPKSDYVFLLNHMNILLNLQHTTLKQILALIKPNIIFTAHSHKARMVECNECFTSDSSWPDRKHVTLIKDSKIYPINLMKTGQLSEVTVPTCSYRMGVEDMGYGAAVLDSSGHLHFTVLWLPSRHTHFFIYIFTLLVIAICTVVYVLMQCSMRRKSRLY